MIHVCARFYSALLSEIYKPKTKLVRGFPQLPPLKNFHDTKFVTFNVLIPISSSKK